jgi:hypothetical protein
MSNPDPTALTSSGRTDVPEPPTEPTPLDELSVAELGAAWVENYRVTCPEQSDDSCPYQYNERGVRGTDIAMLTVYPECEVCGCMLVVEPQEGDNDE